MPQAWTTAVSAVTSGMSEVVTTISSDSVMILSVAVPFVACCIALAKKLLRFGGSRR